MGLLCCWGGDLARARELLEEELEPATQHGEKRRAFVLLRLAEVEWRAGDLDAAERNTAEPAEIFLDGGDPWGSAQVLTTQALLAAIRGREAESRRLVSEAISRESDHGSKHQAIANRWVLGFLELSLDQPDRAYELLGPLPDGLEALGVGEPGLIPVVPDVVEALVALGRLEVAETMVRRFEEQAAALQHRWAMPAALRCRALVLLGCGEAKAALVSAEAAVDGIEHRVSVHRPAFPLIPRYGALGTAWATLAAYAVATTIGNFFHPDTRPVFWMQVRSLSPVSWVAALRVDLQRSTS